MNKSGERCHPANYKGMCEDSTMSKLPNSTLNRPILTFLIQHRLLSQSQAGFMTNHRTTDLLPAQPHQGLGP
ncbi:hypothetical protein XELAEV_18037920mg [Xenopus laevis]|uniref:Uncharacterized protein n=1 Tax=Xenopus laevis TaxID=8355 RepID=A0A974HB23_XENLA|nr:hypothetical protein XELAEV_18037920mg [Xenopus laevis]